jgi:hypothetical protein
MGLIRSTFSILARPITSTASTVNESGRRIKEDIERLRRARARLHLEAEELRRARTIAGTFSDEELMGIDPDTLKDPAQKFRALFLQNGWTEALLSKRLRVVKARKYCGIAVAVLMFFGGNAMLFTAPAWLALISLFITLSGSALGLSMTFLYGLYQSQLETRSIHGARAYWGRPDLISHLLS